LKKTGICAALLMAVFSMGLPAQSVINLNDPFYDDVQVWEALGILSNLPPLRPYPVQFVRAILEKVASSEYLPQQEKAQEHYERFFRKPFQVGVEGNGTIGATGKGMAGKQADGALIVAGNLSILNNISITYDFDVLGSNKEPYNEIIPANSGYRYDTYNDAAGVGPLNIFGSLNSAAAVGTDKLWVQAGMSRSSWGNFYDNGVVISPQAYHTGNIFLVINQERWNYSMGMFILGASTDLAPRDSEYPYPNKFMAMHSLTLLPFKWLEFTYYENSVYGKRFDPLYLLPVSPYMISQELIGYADDNIQMGMAFRVKPLRGFSWASNFFLDDISFNDIVRLKFDTKIRIAGQTGVTWVPPVPFIKALTFDYTLVTPYTYAHYDYSVDDENNRVNYQNYTNYGRSLGATIPPNSDRITLMGKFEPLKDLRIDAFTTFIRHANVNESLPQEYVNKYLQAKASSVPDFNLPTDGSIMDSPNAGEGYFDYAHENLMFMEQETKQYIFQLGFNTAWTLPKFRFGAVSLLAAYTFEYIYNDGMDGNNMFNAGSADADATTTALEDKAKEQKAAWRKSLYNSVNNYVTLGVKIIF
jgi:hypothetical protein